MSRENGIVKRCWLCGSALKEHVEFTDVLSIACPACGEYTITDEAMDRINRLPRKDKAVLSGTARERVERGLKPLHIRTENIEQILNDPRVPRSPIEKMDRLLLSVYRRSGTAGTYVPVEFDRDLCAAYAVSREEFDFMRLSLLKQGSLESGKVRDKSRQQVTGDRLTVKGWERVRELETGAPRTDQCFVAMWFDASLDSAFEKGIRRAVSEAGYKPLRVDLKEHNEKICDAMIAEIRRSGLLIADCTGHRQNVYFEAGFAMGLGIPCIFTCQEEHMKTPQFDTRQYSHVVWKDPHDLYKKLLNRILATAPLKRAATGSTKRL